MLHIGKIITKKGKQYFDYMFGSNMDEMNIIVETEDKITFFKQEGEKISPVEFDTKDLLEIVAQDDKSNTEKFRFDLDDNGNYVVMYDNVYQAEMSPRLEVLDSFLIDIFNEKGAEIGYDEESAEYFSEDMATIVESYVETYLAENGEENVSDENIMRVGCGIGQVLMIYINQLLKDGTFDKIIEDTSQFNTEFYKFFETVMDQEKDSEKEEEKK